MRTELKKIYVGVYGLCRKGNEVLVIEKARGPYRGLYDLPGGGINFGETVEECLKREILEETGGTLIHKKLLDIGEFSCRYEEKGIKKDFHHIGIYFLVDLKIKKLKDKPDGQDSNGAKFVAISKLTQKNTAPIIYPIIKNYLALLILRRKNGKINKV